MSKFVQRDGGGNICGAFTGLQSGCAEEELADDAPELVEFLAKPLADAETKAARRYTFSNDTGAADLLARARTASPAEIDTWLTNNVTNLAQARTVLAAVIKVLVARVL